MMKKILLLLLLLVFNKISAIGQERKWEDIDTSGFYQKQVLDNGKYKLNFIVKDPAFDPNIGQKLIELFFKVYPEEVKVFNSKAITTVTFVVSAEYEGVAATANGVIKFNPKWFKEHPEDIDCATHELMHVVQDYHGDNPGWLVEGIADYARNAYGLNNSKANWKLGGYQPGSNYKNAYQTTAAFLLWLEKSVKKDIVRELNTEIREKRYSERTWITLTGKSVDDLWEMYSLS